MWAILNKGIDRTFEEDGNHSADGGVLASSPGRASRSNSSLRCSPTTMVKKNLSQ